MERENIGMYFKWSVPVEVSNLDTRPPAPVTLAYPVHPADDSDE